MLESHKITTPSATTPTPVPVGTESLICSKSSDQKCELDLDRSINTTLAEKQHKRQTQQQKHQIDLPSADDDFARIEMPPPSSDSVSPSHQDLMKKLQACTSPKQAFKVFDAESIPPNQAAQILVDAGDAIDVTELGTWIGSHHEFWKQVVNEYPKLFHQFKGLSVVEAIRTYLWRFRLPGESAQIERIMNGFSQAYYTLNSEYDGEDSANNSTLLPNTHFCSGYYVAQPKDANGNPCCTHCGSKENVDCCRGCDLIHFCRRCIKLASRRGHAAVGTIGHGRACRAARRLHNLPPIIEAKQDNDADDADMTKPDERYEKWPRLFPFRNADSVFVLSYSIIMLTTNLHSVKVKEKMAKSAFLRQNVGINDGNNFPGDFLVAVYNDIATNPLAVMAS